jgi:hypothetical protein
MKPLSELRREFLQIAGTSIGAALLPCTAAGRQRTSSASSGDNAKGDHTIHIATNPIEIAPDGFTF